jgi:hypothetical protein
MRIVISSSEVPDLIRRYGGRLFVWRDPHRCCGGAISYLVTALEPRAENDFQLFDAEDFELWFDRGGKGPPDELHLAVKGFLKKRVAAYWNGCALVI